MRIRCSLSFALLVLSIPVFPQATEGLKPGEQTRVFFSVPENAEARGKLEQLFYAPIEALSTGQERTLEQQSTGTRVKFETRRQNGHLYYLFQNMEHSSYAIPGRGNYILKRELETGHFVQIKIFYRSDPGCFLRLFPRGNRSSMDVYLFGVEVAQGVLLPVEFTDLLTLPFGKVIELSQSTVHWQSLLYKRFGPLDELAFSHVEKIRRLLPGLSDRDDGALDAAGRYVFIASGEPQGGPGGLNCSGFAKWISDGFYHGLTGRYLAVEPLKEKHLEYRGNRWSLRFEEERDPYFGLDWSRNLAVSLWRAQGYPVFSPEEFDVRRVEYLAYREDVGFPVEKLQLLMFLEAAANPGTFYIGSLNREYGSEPVLRQHFHMIVLFPYFTSSGTLRIAVFDRNREVTLEGTADRYSGAYIHLVRLPLGDSFVPQLPLKLNQENN
jgi:hypothetical protein